MILKELIETGRLPSKLSNKNINDKLKRNLTYLNSTKNDINNRFFNQ